MEQEHTEKETEFTGRDPKTGQFAKGNSLGGRPKGCLSKFTRIKEDIADIWAEEGGKGRFSELFKNKAHFFKLMHFVISILPKDPIVKVDQNEHNTNTTVIYRWAESSDDKLHPPRLPEGEPGTPGEIQDNRQG